jgi:hypothetical protein
MMNSKKKGEREAKNAFQTFPSQRLTGKLAVRVLRKEGVKNLEARRY